MKLIIDKLKYFLNTILNYLKGLLSSIFGGLFNIFTNNPNNNELKSIKIDKENKDLITEINSSDSTGYHDENPDTIVLNKDTTFSITSELLEELIRKRFCEELEIEEKDLTKNEKEYIKGINEIIFPTIKKDISMGSISNENETKNEVKRLIRSELEKQYNLEKNNMISAEKIIILPLLVDRKTIPVKSSTDNTPTFFEVKAKELNIEITPNINNSISNESAIPSTKEDTCNSINKDIPNIEQDKIDILENEIISDTTDISYYNDLANDKIENLNNNNTSNNNSLDSDNEIENDLENDIEVLDNSSTSKSASIPNNNLTPPSIHIQIMEETLKDLNEPLKFEKITETNEKYEKLENYDFMNFDNLLEKVKYTFESELKKEELEDKNYELLETLIQDLLEKIEKLKLKNLIPAAKQKLIAKEKELIALKENLDTQKQKDINIEKTNLDELILTEDLKALELEVQKLHINEKLDLQEYMLNSLEDLDTLTIEKAKKIEKELLKRQLNKILHRIEIPSLLALPFIRNKYFLYFTCGLFANRHLKLFDSILKRKTLEYEPEEIAHIKTGAHALEDALLMSNQNIEYLNYLEAEAFRKHPELKMDIGYLNSLNKLKNKLLKNQEKLLKKEKMIQKHNLKLKKKIRKLKKKEKNQNI